jgi:hypothetical protein
MNRCRYHTILALAVLLASVFLLLSCGFPIYVNFDEEIQLTPLSSIGDQLTLEATINDAGLAKMASYQANDPALKFFYVVSTNPSLSNPVFNSGDINVGSYSLDNVNKSFDSYFKGKTGNGRGWGPENQSSEAPGFFLYSKTDGTHRNFARFSVDIEDEISENAGILVGTFSEDLGSGNFTFGQAPYMDVPLSFSSSKKSFTFTLKKTASEPDGPYAITISVDGSSPRNFASYKKHYFPSQKEQVQTLIAENEYFYDPLKNTPKNFYLHIWAAVYLGEGNFTNIYWSALKYLGALNLF